MNESEQSLSQLFEMIRISTKKYTSNGIEQCTFLFSANGDLLDENGHVLRQHLKIKSLQAGLIPEFYDTSTEKNYKLNNYSVESVRII